MARKPSLAISPEAISQLKILSGITGADEMDIIENGIALIYAAAPREISKRVSLDSIVNSIGKEPPQSK